MEKLRTIFKGKYYLIGKSGHWEKVNWLTFYLYGLGFFRFKRRLINFLMGNK